jgi:FKBP-type peptidyl-prolyl cis-trans isomerase FklB
MKSIQTLAVLLLLPALGHAQEQLPSQYKTNKEKASYAVGVNVALDLQRAGFDMNLVIKGLQEVMAGRQAALDEQQRREAIVAFTQEQAQLLSDKNKKEGAALMTAFKKEEGVRSLPSGVLYKILKNGNGKSPKANDRVTVHYKGTLPDNRQFDSSYDRGAPTSFGVQEVIDGWTQVLQQMKVGDKWKVVVPPELAYGEQGFGPMIGPNATLTFEIELLDVEPSGSDDQGAAPEAKQ